MHIKNPEFKNHSIYQTYNSIFCKILQQDIHYEMANFITVFYTHAPMYMHAHTKHHVSLQKNWKGLECGISKT